MFQSFDIHAVKSMNRAKIDQACGSFQDFAAAIYESTGGTKNGSDDIQTQNTAYHGRAQSYSSCANRSHAAESLREGFAAEFVAVDLNEAREALEEITGLINSEDILDKIFSNFCIGK